MQITGVITHLRAVGSSPPSTSRPSSVFSQGFWHRWKRQSSKTCWCPGGVTNSFDRLIWEVPTWLVVWNMDFMNFQILGIIIPTDFHIFRGWNHQPANYCWTTWIYVVQPCTAVISCRVHRQSDENFRCKAGPGILCQGQDISREAGSGWASFGETASRQEKSSRSLAGAPKSQSYLSWVMSYRLSYAGWWFGTCFSICWE